MTPAVPFFSGSLRRPFGGLAAMIAFTQRAVGCQRTRVALRDLTDRQLRDIGLTRSDVETEATRPIWDVPVHWPR